MSSSKTSSWRGWPSNWTETLQWLIVGGGIHGVHLAARLIGDGGVDGSQIRILDPGPDLLCRWRSLTQVTGMSHLRSPGVHHLDLEPFSLTRFAGSRRHRRPGLLRAPYDRPALHLFDTHCEQVMERFGLRDLHLRGAAERCEPGPDGVRVFTSEGRRIEAVRVVLAIGASGQPAWPDWAPKGERRVQHIFDPGLVWLRPEENCLVVGGGITAVQVALRLVREGRKVHLLTRHPLRVHAFDSDPGWLGPKLMPKFQREQDLGMRRSIIQQARHRGSVPPELSREVKRKAARGQLELWEIAVEDLDLQENQVRLVLSDGRSLRGDHLLLATGFDGRRPGGALVDDLVGDAGLPCAACGYPEIDSWLRWHPHIHVMGPLAELELGPVSRNIAGARRAADRILKVLHGASARPAARTSKNSTNGLRGASPSWKATRTTYHA